jgi:alpha-1,3-rhamnosyl/mannosyltransferase
MRARLGLPPRYVLYLGMNKPHKNLARLVEAWAQARRQATTEAAADPSIQMVIAGREDARYPQARQAAERLAADVRFLGAVAEADMPALYSGATLFVFPSLYEGFGLPVLEAMACGAPVACSTAPSLLEIVGDAALTFDPLDVNEMASVLTRALSDEALRRRLGRQGQAQAAGFTWRRAAAETLLVYRQAAAR